MNHNTNTAFVLPEDLPNGSRVAVYGAGEAGDKVLAALAGKRPDVRPVCFLDSHKNGHRNGLDIRKADAGLKRDWDLVLVASAWWREIAAHAGSLDLGPVLVADFALWHKYVYSKQEMADLADRFQAVRALLATDQDRAVYDLVVRARMPWEDAAFMGEKSHVPELAGYEGLLRTTLAHQQGQYLDHVRPGAVRTILHAGAWDGEDCDRFMDFFPGLEAVHGFEPQGTARVPAERLERFQRDGRVRIVPAGLWNEPGRLRLSGSGMACRLLPNHGSAGEEGLVPVTSVDAHVAEHGPAAVDYLCLDVEGAEAEALAGASRTLDEHRPQLAVCIYHRKHDIHELPLFLARRLENYVFHVGHYHRFLNETVLYAVPEELL